MPVLVYSLLRLVLLLLVGAVLWLAGLRSWLLPVAAVLVALPLSYVTLTRPRDAVAGWLAARSSRRRVPADPDAAAEDAALDGPEG